MKCFFILNGSISELIKMTLLKSCFNIIINLSLSSLILPKCISTEFIDISSLIIFSSSIIVFILLWLLFCVWVLLGNLWLKLILLMFSIVSLFNKLFDFTCGVDSIEELWLKLFLTFDKELFDFDGDELLLLIQFSFWLLLFEMSSLILLLISFNIRELLWLSIDILFVFDLFKFGVGYSIFKLFSWFVL